MPDFGLQSFAEIIAHYGAEHRSNSENELGWFRIQRTLADAVRLAGLAEKPGGRRFRHQWRLRSTTLALAADALSARLGEIARVLSFAELHGLVAEAIGPIPGVGELMVYDTTVRIAAKVGLEPDAVYLHAGTRQGAAALGFSYGITSIPLNELPGPLAQLSPREAEDILCIYKQDLRRIHGAAV